MSWLEFPEYCIKEVGISEVASEMLLPTVAEIGLALELESIV
jgi:hypothetical protein